MEQEIFLVFKEQDDIIATIKIEPSSFHKIIFNHDTVKELAFSHFIENSDERTLEEIYNIIQTIDYRKATSVYIYHSGGNFYGFSIPVKKVLYRTISYVENQVDLRFQELLSIRFIEDNKIIIDKENNCTYCDTQYCNYCDTKNLKCTKYNLPIIKEKENKFIVNRACFVEMSETIRNDSFEDLYDSMLEKTSNK